MTGNRACHPHLTHAHESVKTPPSATAILRGEDIHGNAYARFDLRHSRIHLTTATRPNHRPTDRLQRLISDAALRTGIVNVQTLHNHVGRGQSTNMKPLLPHRFETLLARTAPPDTPLPFTTIGSSDREPDEGERIEGHAIAGRLLLPSSVCVSEQRPAGARPMEAHLLRRARRGARA